MFKIVAFCHIYHLFRLPIFLPFSLQKCIASLAISDVAFLMDSLDLSVGHVFWMREGSLGNHHIIIILKLGTHFRNRISSPRLPPPARLYPSARGRGRGMKSGPSQPTGMVGAQTLPPPPSSCTRFPDVL